MLRPTAIDVKAKDNYILYVLFDNGESGYFDVKPYIRGNWFSMLQNKDYFSKVKTNGITVEWPDGQDISPDDLFRLCKKLEAVESHAPLG